MTGFAEALGLVMLIGAARSDANPGQAERLRAEVPELMHRYRQDGDETPVRAAVADIMGADWEPSGEWSRFIGGMEA